MFLSSGKIYAPVVLYLVPVLESRWCAATFSKTSLMPQSLLLASYKRFLSGAGRTVAILLGMQFEYKEYFNLN